MKILQTAIIEYFGDTETKIPKCFNKEEYQSWLTLEAFANTEPRQFPCRDCTKSFQKEMRKVNKCSIPSIDVTKIAK